MVSSVDLQVTNSYSTSSFAIKATDTNATLDNGIYKCEVTLTISGINNFSKTSNDSTVVLKGMPILILVSYVNYLASSKFLIQ